MATKTINGTFGADSITIQNAIPPPGFTVLFNSVLTGPFTDNLLTVDGADGNDSIDLFGLRFGSVVQEVTIDGGNGDDNITGSKIADTILGGQGNDFILGASGSDLLKGGDGRDYIYGNCGDDSIFGDSGNDVLFGYGDNDLLYGGTGNDVIHGDLGKDSLYGEEGDDTLYGGDESDLLDGGIGDDLIFGDAGSDFIEGGVGDDTLSYIDSPEAIQVNLEMNVLSGGYASGDILTLGSIENVVGTAFNDLIVGNSLNNLLVGGQRKDTLIGQEGNDLLLGDLGQDLLYGDQGNDVLTGGAGKDLLAGGDGLDTFVLTSLSDSKYAAYDVISDYEGGDILDAPSSVLSTSLTTSLGQAASLSIPDIADLLTLGAFTPNTAIAFTVAGQSGTFVALNNDQAGINSRTDSIIQLQGFDLGLSDITIV